MKKNLVLFFMLICGGLFAQSTDVTFKETTHAFGKIKQHVPATYVFNFTNTSTKNIIVEFASAECGCTTPVWTQGAILKGKTGEVKVTYNAENAGTFSKKVTVKFVNNPTPVVLTISGDVEVAKKDGK